MRVYLAGPMRGIPDFNFPAFDRAAERLRAYGYDVVTPAEIDRAIGLGAAGTASGDEAELPTWWSIDLALTIDLAIIGSCGAIVLLPGWSTSEGVDRELEHATRLGKDVYTYAEDSTGAPALELLIRGPLDSSSGDTPTPDDASAERRVRDPETGGEKGQKLARFDLLPARALQLVAEHYGKGAEKYDDHNWRRGYSWSLSFAAMMRHAWAFWSGEDVDEETGSHHLAAVAFHALALLTFAEDHPEKDDRYGRTA